MSPRHLLFRFCVALLMVGVLFGLGQKSVHSAEVTPGGEIVVDSTADLNDYAPGNSVCSVGHQTDGPCTLRAAITEANQHVTSQNVIIKLPPGEYNLTIPPNFTTFDANDSGDLNIGPYSSSSGHSITIEPMGSGAVVIRSTVEDRILRIGTNATVFIKNLTMRDGHVLIDNTNNDGGGAIHNSGSVSLDGVSLLNNTVSCRSDCTSTDGYISGGAIFNSGYLELKNSTLDGNSANRGSAIFNTGEKSVPNFKIIYSTISNNHTLSQSVITNYSNLTIINSTFSGNDSHIPMTAATGIVNEGVLQIQSSTFANKGPVGGIYNLTGAFVYLQDNIFKAETGFSNCGTNHGTFTSWGYNISNDASCPLTAPGDLINTDPKLGNFGNWGGPTKTIMLNRGSPAIDHKASACIIQYVAQPIPLVDDQRHWARSDGKCDTGAYESPPYWVFLPLISK